MLYFRVFACKVGLTQKVLRAYVLGDLPLPLAHLSANVGRMVVEAIRRGVVEDVVTIAAILEVGGIVDRKNAKWRELIGDEKESELLAQLAAFHAAKRLKGPELRENGIFAKAFFRVKDILRNIRQNALRGVRMESTGRREDILKAVCAGMVDHLYRYNYGNMVNGDNVIRELGKESVVQLQNGDWSVGLPFDLEIPGRRGRMTLLC